MRANIKKRAPMGNHSENKREFFYVTKNSITEICIAFLWSARQANVYIPFQISQQVKLKYNFECFPPFYLVSCTVFLPLCNLVFYCCLAKDLLRGTPAVFPFDFSTGPLLIILHLSLAIARFVTSFIILVHLPHLLLIKPHFCQVICKVGAFLKVFGDWCVLEFFSWVWWNNQNWVADAVLGWA